MRSRMLLESRIEIDLDLLKMFIKQIHNQESLLGNGKLMKWVIKKLRLHGFKG